MDNLYDLARDNHLFRQFKVSDLLFTEYKCLENAAVFNIWSHVNYFVYVLSGKKQWGTPEGEYMIYPGEAIFVKKGANTIHKFFEQDFCALIIFVPDQFIKNVVEQSVIAPVGKATRTDAVLPLRLNTVLSTYFESLFAFFTQKSSPASNLLEIKFKELILNLIASDDNKAISQYFHTLCHTTKSSVRDIMETNFMYNLSLEELARLCNRSLSSFKKDFSDTFGTSPGKWLKEKRLIYSKHLLHATDKSINEIAFDSGFENTSHFIKVFKAAYGLPPLHYRKEHA